MRAGALGGLLGLAAVAGAGAVAHGQSPAPAATMPGDGVVGPVDPRSSGEGPGLEAEPLIVLAGVVVLGLATAGGTALVVRLTRDD